MESVIIPLLTLLAVALIPIAIGYYLLLARRVAPRLAALPLPFAITIFALWIALPWVVLASVAWLVRRCG